MQVKMILGADARIANILWETVTVKILMQSFFFEFLFEIH